MVTPELIDYIQKSLEKGLSLETIGEKLISRGGWTIADVATAIFHINKLEGLPTKIPQEDEFLALMGETPEVEEPITPVVTQQNIRITRQKQQTISRPINQPIQRPISTQNRPIQQRQQPLQQRPIQQPIEQKKILPTQKNKPTVIVPELTKKEQNSHGFAFLIASVCIILACFWIYSGYKSPKETTIEKTTENSPESTISQNLAPADITTQFLLENSAKVAENYIKDGRSLLGLCNDASIKATQKILTTNTDGSKKGISCDSDAKSWILTAPTSLGTVLCIDSSGSKLELKTEPSKDGLVCK